MHAGIARFICTVEPHLDVLNAEIELSMNYQECSADIHKLTEMFQYGKTQMATN